MKAFVFQCRGRDVPPVMVVHAKGFEIAQREAVHRFEKLWPADQFKDARIDASRADIEPADKYFHAY